MVKFFMAVVFLAAFSFDSMATSTEPVDTSFVKAYKYHSDAWIAVSFYREQGLSAEDADLVVQAYFDHFFNRLYRDNLEDVVAAFHSPARRQKAILEFASRSRITLYPAELIKILPKIGDDNLAAEVIAEYLKSSSKPIFLSDILQLSKGIQNVETRTKVLDQWVTTTYSRYLRNVYDSDLEQLNQALGIAHFPTEGRKFVRSSGHRSGPLDYINNTWAAVRSCNEILGQVQESTRRL